MVAKESALLEAAIASITMSALGGLSSSSGDASAVGLAAWPRVFGLTHAV
jgi:hypothetical protein